VRIGALLAGQADFIRQVQAYDEKQVEDQGYRSTRPDARREQQRRLPPGQPAGGRCPRAPGAAACTNAKEIVDAVLGQLSASHLDDRSTAQGYVDLSAKLTFDGQGRGSCSTRPAGPGANGIREKDGQRWC
jgi:peptide/nickel transport system substrate-binding protein